MKKHLRFNTRKALESGVVQHPIKVLHDLGITYLHITKQSVYEEFWFWNCENVPETLPSYLELAGWNPMDLIGYGLSKSEAERIRDYNKEEFTGVLTRDGKRICVGHKVDTVQGTVFEVVKLENSTGVKYVLHDGQRPYALEEWMSPNLWLVESTDL